ncbi:hypothetical protein VCRA2127O344_30515 [Vibrio crassostreae]|nr:hypothetical protein VCRA2127O344_30515 [Vibrio crassostreae]
MTGFNALAADGVSAKGVSGVDKLRDYEVRVPITEEFGIVGEKVTAVYLGHRINGFR